MKLFIYTASMILTAIVCFAQVSKNMDKYVKAKRYGAQAKVTINVFDEKNDTITNATVRIFFRMSSGKSEGEHSIGRTGADGKFSTEGRTTDVIFIAVEKDGFYTSRTERRVTSRDENALQNDRWLPWNPTIPIVLRKIENPIPMYVKQFDGRLPNGATSGFDCHIGNFLPPFGDGVVADFQITLKVHGAPYKNITNEAFFVSCDKDAGFLFDGLSSFSLFKSRYVAPEAGYLTNFHASAIYNLQQGRVTELPFKDSEYIIFKSRVVQDSQKNIVEANYGKIIGALKFGRSDDELHNCSISFVYYFNPTPNSRNLEFDGKNNLFYPQYKTSQFAP